MIKVKFKQRTCEVVFGKYASGGVSITLVDSDETVAIATVDTANGAVKSGEEVTIRNYGENYGILAALVDVGVIADPYDFKQPCSDFGVGYVCKLLKKGYL